MSAGQTAATSDAPSTLKYSRSPQSVRAAERKTILALQHNLTFEIRLEGPGGGVWSVRVHDSTCTVSAGFAENADVRYTADAPVWCAVALGLIDARETFRRGLMTKEGGRPALDHYFHQVPSARMSEETPK